MFCGWRQIQAKRDVSHGGALLKLTGEGKNAAHCTAAAVCCNALLTQKAWSCSPCSAARASRAACLPRCRPSWTRPLVAPASQAAASAAASRRAARRSARQPELTSACQQLGAPRTRGARPILSVPWCSRVQRAVSAPARGRLGPECSSQQRGKKAPGPVTQWRKARRWQSAAPMAGSGPGGGQWSRPQMRPRSRPLVCLRSSLHGHYFLCFLPNTRGAPPFFLLEYF